MRKAKNIYIVITKVTEQPNEDQYWSYPVEEIEDLIAEIEDGDRENGYEFYLYDNRLYETEETEIW